MYGLDDLYKGLTMTREATLTRALEQILHSVKQAQKPGNDWRRELKLIENTVKEALE